jgi:hypothetical protein
MTGQFEYFPYTCPHCSDVRNASDVAAELPTEVLRAAVARVNARSRITLGTGPGRPAFARCPGCSLEMSYEELREHRIDCVRRAFEKIRGMRIRLAPKDPDPYPDFYFENISDSEVQFSKGSNGDRVTVDLRKVSEIVTSEADKCANIRLLGRVVWREDIKRWRFAPTAAVGRPIRLNTESE